MACGLALLVQPTGVKSWQLRYKLHGKDQTWTIGKGEKITLHEARNKAKAALDRVENGEHLTRIRHQEKKSKRLAAGQMFAVLKAAWITREADARPRTHCWRARAGSTADPTAAAHRVGIRGDMGFVAVTRPSAELWGIHACPIVERPASSVGSTPGWRRLAAGDGAHPRLHG